MSRLSEQPGHFILNYDKILDISQKTWFNNLYNSEAEVSD